MVALTLESRLLNGVRGLLCQEPSSLPTAGAAGGGGEHLPVVDIALRKTRSLWSGLGWRGPVEQQALSSTVGTNGGGAQSPGRYQQQMARLVGP